MTESTSGNTTNEYPGMADVLRRLSVVMVGTSDAANIGAVCRAMNNFGQKDLLLVAPRASEPQGARARALACMSEDILEAATIADSLEDAAAKGGIVHFAGTTGRVSHARGPFLTPEDFAAEALPYLMRGERIGLVLGREDSGLTTDEIERCRWKVNIPTGDVFSLNVAQACVVMLYAMRREAMPTRAPAHSIVRAASPDKLLAAREVANPAELERMLQLLEAVMLRINFAWKSNPRKLLRPLRQMLQRAEATAREVGIINSFARRTLYALGDKSFTRAETAARREALRAGGDGSSDESDAAGARPQGDPAPEGASLDNWDVPAPGNTARA